uniref:MATH domain-containing protein n=1 Tax=Steinernema glaseri TaxID=37863 RepID=A0A1I8ACS0_9BILA
MSIRDVSREEEISSGACRRDTAADISEPAATSTVGGALWALLCPTFRCPSPEHIPSPGLCCVAAFLMDEQFVGSPVLFQQLITVSRCAQAPKIEISVVRQLRRACSVSWNRSNGWKTYKTFIAFYPSYVKQLQMEFVYIHLLGLSVGILKVTLTRK